ncbi:MAG: hypothetical protein ACR2JG_11600 [Geodermatophilaceae bacterium]
MTKTILYVGNGPYFFTNSLLMALGEAAPPAGVVETLTASPFGFQLLGGELPVFDPYGWNPDLGLDQAIELLGYRCRRATHETAAEALASLEAALTTGPVLVGPVDMGLLAHQPGSDRAAGADHFVVVLAAVEGSIRFHDPQGHPHAVLPTEVFLAAWHAEQIGYLAEDAFVMRTDFEQVSCVSTEEALNASLDLARRWALGREELPVPPGTLGGRAAYEQFAEQLLTASPGTMNLLSHFSIPVGARRRGDAATCFETNGSSDLAERFTEQAVTLGSLQYAAVLSDATTLVRGCRRLGELHDDLIATLGNMT